MKKIEKSAKQFERYDFGSILISKLTIFPSWLVFLKIFGFSQTVIILSVPAIIIGIWVIGWLSDKSGFRKEFIRRRFKGVND